MAVSSLLDDPSFLIIDNSSNYVSNITPTGLKDDYSNSSNHLNFNMRRFDGADTTKACLFPQYYNTNYSQWVVANYQTLGGQTFIDNIASWSGITLPAGANNKYLCLPYPTSSGGSLDFTQAYWTTLGSNTPTYYYVKPFATINISEGSGGDSGDTPASDFSQISNAIYSLGAVIIVVCFFSMIYKIFHRLRG